MYVSLPTRTVIPSMMAKVNGSLSVKTVPLPSAVLMLTAPPSPSILRLTTSIPTPRPETSVTFSAVENPGLKIKGQIWSSDSFSCSAIKPCLIALARILSRFNPRPSSSTVTQMLPPEWKALSRMVPSSGLLLSRRSSGISNPWSAEFRTRCVSGSPMDSMTVLSNSVSSPDRTS